MLVTIYTCSAGIISWVVLSRKLHGHFIVNDIREYQPERCERQLSKRWIDNSAPIIFGHVRLSQSINAIVLDHALVSPGTG
jgi:hypothetical protein